MDELLSEIGPCDEEDDGKNGQEELEIESDSENKRKHGTLTSTCME